MSRPDCRIDKHATPAIWAIAGRNDNGFHAGQVSVAVRANQRWEIAIGPIGTDKAKQHDRKSDCKHDDRSENVGEVWVVVANNPRNAQRGKHWCDRAGHTPGQLALASADFGVVFSYGHAYQAAWISVG